MLSKLKPQLLWDFFAKICSIPHPSHHEEELASAIIKWVQEKKLFFERDQFGNILVRKSATKGYENRCSIAIQAHLDMVPQKNNDITHNFAVDPIIPKIDREWVKAKETTLGADNGIGIASALAILMDNNIKHGPIEVLFTMTEETGMLGAFNLKPKWLKSNILINTDSDKEGQVYIGCAGAVNLELQLPISYETIPPNFKIIKIILKGLKGGHSGSSIHLGLGNAIKLLINFLVDFCKILNFKLLNLHGGTSYNSIPRESSVIIAVPYENIDLLRNKIQDYFNSIKNEFKKIENKIMLEVNYIENSNKKSLTDIHKDRLITLINTIPNGIIKMSNKFQNLVETSLNISIISMDDKMVKIYCLIRSLNENGKLQTQSTLYSLAKLSGAIITSTNNYPSWESNSKSQILSLIDNIYCRIFNKKIKIKVIHAGLECSLLKKSYPNIDMVSIGPTITGAHSPNEQVNIKSVLLYWNLLINILKEAPIKLNK